MNELELATIGANLEAKFDKISKEDPGTKLDTLTFTVEDQSGTCSYEFTLLDKMEFTNETGETFKAFTLRDQNGNIYVHYRGTGDANWDENDVAFGGGPSDIQETSRKYLDESIAKYGDTGKVYVTGHSQGGNNAQYATLTTEYGDRVEMCVSMDGQGFSKENVERMKNLYGEEQFERQCEKLYGVHGDKDFVSPLGQVHLIPDDRITYIDCDDSGFAMYHDARGLLNGTSLRKKVDDDSAFRKFVAAMNEKVANLPPDQQKRIAELAMIVAEYVLGDGEGGNYKGDMTFDDITELVTLLLPVLAELALEDPELFQQLMREYDVPDFIVDKVFPVLIMLAKGVIAVVEAVQQIYEAIKSLKEYLHSLTPGAKYAAENPYIKADTAAMREYARRLKALNSRLVQLDRDLDSLYWQVGLLDLAEIITANLITSYSVNLTLARNFLNKTAEELEQAENKAAGYMGG